MHLFPYPLLPSRARYYNPAGLQPAINHLLNMVYHSSYTARKPTVKLQALSHPPGRYYIDTGHPWVTPKHQTSCCKHSAAQASLVLALGLELSIFTLPSTKYQIAFTSTKTSFKGLDPVLYQELAVLTSLN